MWAQQNGRRGSSTDHTDEMSPVTGCPRFHARGPGPFDQLGLVRAGHFLGEAAHEHTPATPSPLIDLIHLERHIRVVGRGELRASSSADHDHTRAIKYIIHRKDERIMFGTDELLRWWLRLKSR
jgi:hypothetical protein